MPKKAEHPKKFQKPIPKALDNRSKQKERDRGEKKMAKGKSKKGRC